MQLLLIFVKHPQAGKVKTRLARSIGHEKAVAVYQELLTFTRTITKPLTATKAVFYGNFVPPTDLWAEAGFPRKMQVGESLGDRMCQAFQWGFAEGYQKILIIGSDCPHISTALLEDAFAQLDTHDFVIGPAKDGGYYLLGMKTLLPTVFEQKEWSTNSVFEATCRDIQDAGMSVFHLPTLSDIDVIDDLQGTFLEKYAL